jgi:L-ascorbate metabolism protein UlaG (beta-lactamase superfamily)
MKNNVNKIALTILAFVGMLAFATVPAYSQIPPVFSPPAAAGVSLFHRTNINDGQVAFMWLGEGVGEWAGTATAGVMVKTSKYTIIIDPSNVLPSDAIDAMESLDLILITHEHSDHFDPDSTVAIHQKTGAPVMVSAGVYPLLQEAIDNENLIEMLAGDVKTVNEITVTAIRAQHPAEKPVMYLIEIDDITVFHGSDSGFVSELNDIDSEVHLAFVPAGQPSPTASPDVAANMVRALKPYVTVPVHGMFEEMKALEEMVGSETVVIIPDPYAFSVPTQIVPEFPVAILVFIAAFVTALIAFIRIRNLGPSRQGFNI